MFLQEKQTKTSCNKKKTGRENDRMTSTSTRSPLKTLPDDFALSIPRILHKGIKHPTTL